MQGLLSALPQGGLRGFGFEKGLGVGVGGSLSTPDSAHS